MFTEPQSDGDDIINNVINDGDEQYSENFESDVEEERSEVARTGTELLNTSGAGELAALQQALQAAHLESTGDSARPLGGLSRGIFQGNFILWLFMTMIARYFLQS